MSRYKICRTFTVESGHMLSKHPASCRFPHGHTRKIEVIILAESLDQNDMVVDFKALKLALQANFSLYDHSMAINSEDSFLPALQAQFPKGVVVFENEDPTTEVMARKLFETVRKILRDGWSGDDINGTSYKIAAGLVELERVRVWETPNAWAEYGQ